jgi:hypothetical protein
MFPCLARLIAVRAMLSASRASMSCNAIVALPRDPRGRPAGFPLWPFSNGMISLSFDVGTTQSDARTPHAGMKKPGAVARPGFNHQTQLWMMIKLCEIR